METWLCDKRVAVVGNSTSLFSQNHGKHIDSHDIVIRINRAAPICFVNDYKNLNKTHGIKTDIWAFSFADTMKIELNMFHSVTKKLIQMNPKEKNKIVFPFFFETESDQNIKEINKDINDLYIKSYDNDFIQLNDNFFTGRDFLRIYRERKRPKKDIVASTGIRVLHWVSKYNTKCVNVYGFDWKQTPTFYDKNKKTRHNEKEHSHNFFIEEKYCDTVFRQKHEFNFL